MFDSTGFDYMKKYPDKTFHQNMGPLRLKDL